MKRIIICCDGTWNTPDKTENGILCYTNVVKVAQAVKPFADDGIQQLTYYDLGVGSRGFILQRIFDGATGSGISKNILKAYRYVLQNYRLNDELFFFGFSRGAFTVRSLAGLIRNSGILKSDDPDLIKRAYNLYRSRSPLSHPRAREATLFRKTFAVADIVPIKFIGVWDTVGSLGNPLFINNFFSKISLSVLGNQFHDTDLSSTVSFAYQALAIDEKRRNFEPTLWHQQDTSGKQKMEQVWFAGVHSNIGGGYPENGLSDIALNWLTAKAKECDLDIDEIPMDENYMEAPKESWKGFYELLPPYYREIGVKENGNESVHQSAIDKYNKDENYHPKNLKKYLNKLYSLAGFSENLTQDQNHDK
jgi:uncharacterized protein (DUF2235 family)